MFYNEWHLNNGEAAERKKISWKKLQNIIFTQKQYQELLAPKTKWLRMEKENMKLQFTSRPAEGSEKKT